MSPDAPGVLDSVARAFSLFNTIALLWLGLTVILNSEKRTWGAWVISAGLAFGGIFFIGHSTLVGAELGALSPQMEFWWHAVWLLFISQPYFWYLVIAWYSGTLRSRRNQVRLAVVSLLGLAALVFLVVSDPLPSYGDILRQSSITFPALGGVPVVLLVYPVYSVACFVLAILMLKHPASSNRFMGELGRQRARPWLMGASLVLLVVSLAVGGMAAWFLHGIQTGEFTILSPGTLATLTRFDLVISGLVAVVTVLVGQAIVSYEVFTGKPLPRGGLLRHWRYTLILAVSYGILVAASLSLRVDPIYHLLLATVMMTVFYALFSWRSYAERERSIERLRPFVASQRLYENLLTPAGPLEADTGAAFKALCDDVLGARLAYLAPIGPVASLVGQVFSFPGGAIAPGLGNLATDLGSPKNICEALDPARYAGAVWGVPLWSERGMIGVLLLGPKRDGRLYAQEEIEIARAACERLIDTQASAEMARRLMALQRQRLVQSQVLDQNVRRVLHDDILPSLHAALLSMNRDAGPGRIGGEAATLVTEVHHRIASLIREMPASTSHDAGRLGPIEALRRAVDNELSGAFDGVTWAIEPEAARLAPVIPSMTAEVVFFAAREAARNAARHGRQGHPNHPLHLAVSAAWDGGLHFVIEDDGVGLGAADKAVDGGGQGLALHSTMMAVIGGTLGVEEVPGGGTRVTLSLPHQEA